MPNYLKEKLVFTPDIFCPKENEYADFDLCLSPFKTRAENFTPRFLGGIITHIGLANICWSAMFHFLHGNFGLGSIFQPIILIQNQADHGLV